MESGSSGQQLPGRPVRHAPTPETLALVFDLFLPLHTGKEKELQAVLDSLFDKSKISEGLELGSIDDPKMKERIIANVEKTISGYSLSVVQGRYRIEARHQDDTVWRLQIIVDLGMAPSSRTGPDQRYLDLLARTYREFMRQIVDILVIKLYSKEVGEEEEIWLLESEMAKLQRWVKL